MQSNGVDCGVFVCRYAQSIMELSANKDSFKANADFFKSHKRTQLMKKWITHAVEFKFDQTHIDEFRNEMFVKLSQTVCITKDENEEA